MQIRILQTTPEQTIAELGVDYSRASIPDRAYYADYTEVRRGRSGYSLIFAKLEPGTSRLRTKIEVTFPREMFARQLWAGSRDFHETVKKLTAGRILQPVGEVTDTDKVQTFRSNNVFMGVWGEEALMDFYYISPRDMHLARLKAADIGLEPVIRVVMGSELMFEFLEMSRPFAEAETITAAPVEVS